MEFPEANSIRAHVVLGPYDGLIGNCRGGYGMGFL